MHEVINTFQLLLTIIAVLLFFNALATAGINDQNKRIAKELKQINEAMHQIAENIKRS